MRKTDVATNSPKANTRILEAVRSTARDLHGAGLIDGRRMAKFDALCVEVNLRDRKGLNSPD